MCVSVLNKNQDVEEMGGCYKKINKKKFGNKIGWKNCKHIFSVENEFSPVMTFALPPSHLLLLCVLHFAHFDMICLCSVRQRQEERKEDGRKRRRKEYKVRSQFMLLLYTYRPRWDFFFSPRKLVALPEETHLQQSHATQPVSACKIATEFGLFFMLWIL